MCVFSEDRPEFRQRAGRMEHQSRVAGPLLPVGGPQFHGFCPFEGSREQFGRRVHRRQQRGCRPVRLCLAGLTSKLSEQGAGFAGEGAAGGGPRRPRPSLRVRFARRALEPLNCLRCWRAVVDAFKVPREVQVQQRVKRVGHGLADYLIEAANREPQ